MMTLRSLLFILFLIGLARYSELAPTRSKDLSNDELSSSSLLSSSMGGGTSSRKGSRGSSSSSSSSSPSELTWEAWLLVDTQAGDHASLDSANILRKITPKSIFFAPTRIECAEGYRADTMDRCVKDVKIDHEAQFDFLLKRVSAMYLQRFPTNAQEQKIKNQKQSSGPLQLSIPLLGVPPPPAAADAAATSSVINQQLIKNEDDGTNEPPKETVTVYEAKIETTTKEDEKEEDKLGQEEKSKEKEEEEEKPLILLENINKNDPIKKDTTKSEEIVPVAEFVDETNGSSSFSEIVDYKIPIDLKAILNVTNVKKSTNGSEIINDDSKLKEVLSMNVSSIAPTLVFVLTPTKQPHVESSSSSKEEDDDPVEDLSNVTTTGHVIIRMTELINSSNQNVDEVNESNSMIPPLKKLSESSLIFEDKIDNNGGNNSEASGMKMEDDEEQETIYEDEEPVDEEDVDEENDDYVDTTDNPIEEELTELEGEILKHGEAGITIPVKNLDRLHLKEDRDKDEEGPMVDSNIKNLNNTFESSRDEIAIRFNHSIPNTDESDSKISSEATIKDDVIIETTLLNVNNPTKLSNDTKYHLIKNNTTKINEDERFNEHFESEKIHDNKSKVLFPTEEIPTTIVSTSTEENVLSNKKQQQQQVSRTKFDDENEKNPTDLRNVELLAEPSSSESLLYDPRFDNRYLEASITEVEDSTKTSNSFSTRNILDLEGSPSYVRSSQSYVKFPSDEINSIHNQDYKDGHQHHRIFEEGPPYVSTTSTKSSVPIFHQKSSYSRTPPIGWRIDRPEQQQEDNERHRSVVVVQRQKPRPMYLYRTKAPPPLTRISPSLFSIGQGGPRSTPTIMDRGYRNDYVRVSSRRRVKY
ncbi:FK506-binding protein 5-like [Polistes fuscatus]|uniref:FK506-binding protein 5-like n=1 Tax=Polistes fuscatus TaxID=30207 RepID=UPI001CAA3E06|nr:FK506-binding protein 5-like [Polistes fuscatus]